MKGGTRNKKGKPPSNNKTQDRAPLCENRETVATNSSSLSHLAEDSKISTLQVLNNILIRDIATVRGERDALLKKEKESQDVFFESETRLNEEIAKKEDECRAVIEEKNCLESRILQLREQSEEARSALEAEKAELLSKLREEALFSLNAKVAEVEKQVEDRLKEECKREILKKENDSQAAIYEVKESAKVLEEVIAKKEEQCQALLSERKNMEANLVQLKGQMWAMSEESKAAQMSWEFEKSMLSSQVAAAGRNIEEIGRSHEMLQKAWEVDKECLLAALWKSEEKAAEILKKSDVALCQLNEKYEEVCIESETLKFQLKESKDMLVSMEDERQAQTVLSATNTERLEALLIENKTLKQKTNDLQQKVTEGSKQYSELNQQHQASEKSLKHQVEWRQKDIDSTRALLEIQRVRVEELSVENGGLYNEIQELTRSWEEMQGIHVKVVEEKGLLTKELESLHTEFTKKCSELDEEELKMLTENENQRKVIDSLYNDMAFLESEKTFVVWRLEEATQRSEENQEKHFQSSRRVLDLEDQVSKLCTNLAAASSVYDTVTAELNEIKEDANKQQGELSVENAQLRIENQQLSTSLAEATKRFEEIQGSLFQSSDRVLGLEDQVSELRAELAAARSAYDAVTAELSKVKDDTSKQVGELSDENAHLNLENQQLSTILGETTKRYEEIQGNFDQRSGRVLGLEDQVSELHRELAAARSIYDAVTAELTKIKEDATKQANEFCEIKEEKEAMHGDLMLQISRNKELELELLSANSLFKKVSETACMAEGRMVNLQSQFSAFAEEKESQSFHFLGQLPVFAEVLSGELRDLHYQVSKLTEEKHCLEEKNNSLQAEMTRLHLSSEGKKNQQGIEDNFNNNSTGTDIRPRQSLPEHQHSRATENKKQWNMHIVWSAWGALAAVTLAAAYLKFSK